MHYSATFYSFKYYVRIFVLSIFIRDRNEFTFELNVENKHNETINNRNILYSIEKYNNTHKNRNYFTEISTLMFYYWDLLRFFFLLLVVIYGTLHNYIIKE